MFQTSESFCRISSSKIKRKKAKYFWNAEYSKAVAMRKRSRRKYEKIQLFKKEQNITDCQQNVRRY